MEDPLIELRYFLGAGLLILLPVFLYLSVKKGRKTTTVIPLGIVVIGLLVVSISTYRSYETDKAAVVNKFLGLYTLKQLDGQDCINCQVRLNGDFRYDIIVDQKVAGHGTWSIGVANNVPFLRVENGPNYAILEYLRVVDYIDRRKN